MNSLMKLHKTVSSQLKNESVLNTLRALLVVKALSVRYLPTELLSVYQTLAARVVVALLVVYLVSIDPILAVLVTVVFVLCLREANNRSASALEATAQADVKDNVDSEDVSELAPVVVADATNEVPPMVEPETVEDGDAPVVEPEVVLADLPLEGEHPVDKTLTENISLGSPEFRQLDAVQSNNVTGTDPDEPVKSFKETLDAQGLSLVQGYNPNASKSSKF